MKLSVEIKADQAMQPVLSRFEYSLKNGEETNLAVSLSRSGGKTLALESNHYDFVRTVGRKWPIQEPEKFYRVPDLIRARFQNAGFLLDFALETEALLKNLHYLGPLRSPPKRIYTWSGETPEDVGQSGEYAVAAILAAKAQRRKLNRMPRTITHEFDEFIAGWLKDIGVIEKFELKQVAVGRKEYEVLIQTHPQSSVVRITDVGFGISQVLPALVQAFYAPKNSVVLMEQPEIHLHPQVQAELADVFLSAIRSRENGVDRGVQLIVESHSEHLLNRLQRRVAEGAIKPEQIAVYFCRKKGMNAVMEPLNVDISGEITNWPDSFFGDEMADITARTVAAMKREGNGN